MSETFPNTALDFARSALAVGLERRSSNGFAFKEIVQKTQPQDLEVLQLITLCIWLNTCGLAPHMIDGVELLSPVHGMAIYLKHNTQFYLALESSYRDILSRWSPLIAKHGIPGLNPTESEIVQAIRTKDGKTHFAKEVEPSEDNLILHGRLLPRFNKKLLELRISDEHPLAAILSGYTLEKDLEVPATDLVAIETENPNTFRMKVGHPLAKLAEEIIDKTANTKVP